MENRWHRHLVRHVEKGSGWM